MNTYNNNKAAHILTTIIIYTISRTSEPRLDLVREITIIFKEININF